MLNKKNEQKNSTEKYKQESQLFIIYNLSRFFCVVIKTHFYYLSNLDQYK